MNSSRKSSQISVFLGSLEPALHQLRGSLSVSAYLRDLIEKEIDRLGGEASLRVELAKEKIAKLQALIDEEEKKKEAV